MASCWRGSYRDGEGYHYEGEFSYFTYNGEGTLTRPDGVTISATFVDGPGPWARYPHPS